MGMQMAFYRAWGDGNVWDKVISIASLSPYSHVELRFSDGMFFSSSPRDGGCRMKWIIPDENWVLVDLPISEWSERSIRCEAELLADAKVGYDWLGVFRFGMPLLHENPELYFCSEVCLRLCQRQWYFTDAGKPYLTRPSDLAKYLKRVLPSFKIDVSKL